MSVGSGRIVDCGGVVGVGVLDGMDVGVRVGGTGVAVGGIGVDVGGTGVAVGGIGVAVGPTGDQLKKIKA